MRLVGLIGSILDREISRSMISQKVKNFACADVLNLTKNRKTTNISENLDILPESSEQHLDKVLTFIGLIGAGYLTCSSIVQKLQVPDLSSLRKIKNFQTRWKPFILLPKVVMWLSTGYDIGRVDWKRSWLRDLLFHDFPKSENGNHSYYFLKWSYDDQQAMTLVGLIESVLDQ